MLYDESKYFMALEKGKSYTLPAPDLWYKIQDVGEKESVSLIIFARDISKENLVQIENGGRHKKGSEVAIPLSDGDTIQNKLERLQSERPS